MKITNTQKGPRGVNTVAGPVLIEPDQTFEGDVFEREREHIEAAGWFKVEGSYTPDPSRGPAPAPAPAPAAQSNNGEVEALRRQLAERDAEIVKLKAAAENDEPDREDLKKQAKELGIEHAPNISTAKLKDLIDAKLAS
ncbi:hypothetical protein ACLE20_13435 [Rhizobium sp. YIM 134829]|uniref:hypothetical protein n=1 Tax=Rhizobium sp. YIM 134829 TaxID=3390453 RepID=UPI00397BEBE6